MTHDAAARKKILTRKPETYLYITHDRATDETTLDREHVRKALSINHLVGFRVKGLGSRVWGLGIGI